MLCETRHFFTSRSCFHSHIAHSTKGCHKYGSEHREIRVYVISLQALLQWASLSFFVTWARHNIKSSLGSACSVLYLGYFMVSVSAVVCGTISSILLKALIPFSEIVVFATAN